MTLLTPCPFFMSHLCFPLLQLHIQARFLLMVGKINTRLIWLRFRRGFPGCTSGKEPTCQCRRRKRCRLNPQVRKIPWRRKWQPTPAFLPGESHGQRSLEGQSPKGCKESHTLLKQFNRQAYTRSLKDTKLFMRAPPPKGLANHRPKASPPNTITLGVKISTCEFQGKTKIQSITDIEETEFIRK